MYLNVGGNEDGIQQDTSYVRTLYYKVLHEELYIYHC